GVFHYRVGHIDRAFHVLFDLVNQEFVHREDREGDLTTYIPLSALFNPRRLLEEQQRLLNAGVQESVLDSVIDLQARFQEYVVPLVTISERNIDEVVVIFERVNSTGLRLSRVDFMRAITWSESFDLNNALDSVDRALEESGFDVSEDTIVKALGLIFDLDPLPGILLKLRSKTSAELASAVEHSKDVFLQTFEFFRNELSIYSSEFIPYEGQVLTVFKVFLHRKRLKGDAARELKRWFLWTSLEEGLQGRPDNFVARTIRLIDQQIEGGKLDIPVQRIDADRFRRRRLLKGKALTTAVITLMANHGVVGPVSGEKVDPALFTGGFSSRNYIPILEIEQLPSSSGSAPSSAKLLANVLFVPDNDLEKIKSSGFDLVMRGKARHGKKFLDGQLISMMAFRHLERGHFEKFLSVRSHSMSALANRALDRSE
ncbi:MAG: hypothetical protein AB7F94_11915, partial [Nitrospira sp.]